MQSQVDLAAVFDEHLRCEFEMHDASATMTTMTDNPHLYHVPTMSGGNGRIEIYEFYRDHFVRQWPADTSITHVSRTIGNDQLVDELIVSFTHDVVMDIFLPGIPPTARYASVPTVVIVKFEDGKVAHEHIYWDQASLLVQVGLLDSSTLPVTGVEQARALADRTYATNTLIARTKPGTQSNKQQQSTDAG
jgi:carboxymethylenebutenolidase